jgi:hypothetical protein
LHFAVAGEDDYTTRWRLIKARFSMAVPKDERILKIPKTQKRVRHVSGKLGRFAGNSRLFVGIKVENVGWVGVQRKPSRGG